MIVDYYGMCFANQGARCWHKVFVVLRILPLCMLLRSIWHIVTVIGQGLSGSCAKSAKAHTHKKKNIIVEGSISPTSITLTLLSVSVGMISYSKCCTLSMSLSWCWPKRVANAVNPQREKHIYARFRSFQLDLGGDLGILHFRLLTATICNNTRKLCHLERLSNVPSAPSTLHTHEPAVLHTARQGQRQTVTGD